MATHLVLRPQGPPSGSWQDINKGSLLASLFQLCTGWGPGILHLRDSDGLCPDVPADRPYLRRNRSEQGSSWSNGVTALQKGAPFSNLRLWEKAQAMHPRSPALSISQPFVFSPRGSLSPQKPRTRARIPAPSAGAEAGADQKLEPGMRAWRGAELSAPILPTLRSVPIAHQPRAQRKMAARSAADSHVSRRYRRTPPPPLAESRTPRDAQP